MTEPYERLRDMILKPPRKRKVVKRRILGERACRSCGVEFAYDDARLRYCPACRGTEGIPSPFRPQPA